MTVFANPSTTVPSVYVSSTARQATFYRESAQITRVAPVSFDTACDEVQVVCPVSWDFDEDSVQVQFSEDLAVRAVLRGVTITTVPKRSEGDEESERQAAVTSEDTARLLEESLRSTKQQIARLKLEKERLCTRTTYIEQMVDNSVDSSVLHNCAALWEVETWEKQLEALETARTSQLKEERVLQQKLEALNREEERLEMELSRFSVDRDALANNLTTRAVVMVLRVREPVVGAEVSISYMVTYGRWVASYDVHLNTITKQLEVHYNAEMVLICGEDLHDVECKLSSAAPSRSGKEPTLDPWRCGLVRAKEPPHIMPRAAGANTLGATAFSPQFFQESAPMMLADEAVVDEASAGVINFSIAALQTIKADGQHVHIPITTIILPAEVSYVSVPSVDAAAFARATAVNVSEYLLLSGEAAICMDGDFITRTHISRCPTGEKLEVDFGADRSVDVKRVLVSDYTTVQRGAMGLSREGPKQVRRYTYRTTITNNKKPRGSDGDDGSVSVLVKELVPVSDEEELVVRLIQPKSLTDGQQKRVFEEEGIVEEHLKVAQGKTVTWELSYEVESPTGAHIFGMSNTP